jgi:polysaccharide export outer membrane protein
VGDELQIAVFGFGDLSTNSAVSNEGDLVLPLVGRISVVGQTLEEAQSQISRRYAHFIRSPQVRVSMKTPVTNRVTVTGEVHKPGPYPLLQKGTLLSEVLAEAGGRSPLASSRIILLPAPRIIGDLMPHNPAQPTLSLVGAQSTHEAAGVEIDTEDLIGNVNQHPLLIPLLPGDTIIVPEAGTYEVDGEVVQPGSFKLTSRTSVIGAIAAARGFTYSAAVNRVEVIRDTGGGRKALIALDLEEVGLRGGQDLRLRNGDLVRVPSEPGRFFKRQVVETINGLFNGVGVNQRMN